MINECVCDTYDGMECSCKFYVKFFFDYYYLFMLFLNQKRNYAVEIEN